MSFFTSPRSYALNSFLASQNALYETSSIHQPWVMEHFAPVNILSDDTNDSHPNLGHLCVLVFEAVLEVVFVALPGYIVARQGLFDAESQKFLANLNVMIFTPCLVFTKLAKQLTADKLVDLAIIPAIFIVQTFISYLSAIAVSKCFKLKKRPRNFVVAMGVFGNSNSLPISLVLSLSKTIGGLHWDQIPGDNDNEVGARGILYLLIFQQLGQLLRWTWGFNVLLKPKDAYTVEEGGSMNSIIEEAADSETEEDDSRTVTSNGSSSYRGRRGMSGEATPLLVDQSPSGSKRSSVYGSAGDLGKAQNADAAIENAPYYDECAAEQDEDGGSKTMRERVSRSIKDAFGRATSGVASSAHATFTTLPTPAQTFFGRLGSGMARGACGVWAFMNPPLWAMLAAIVVASVPPLQSFFFTPGTFVNNSVIHGIEQSAGVAVPLILVVLGANLARNTIPKESIEDFDPSEPTDNKLVVASLLSRMVVPTIFMAPFITLIAKFVPVSILDDPIFVIVVFLLTGAPSALQLSQICQLNSVYMGAISKLLFQSYVVWILPSTLVLVIMALEVVKWAVV